MGVAGDLVVQEASIIYDISLFFPAVSAEAEVNVANSLTVYPPRIKINFI